MKNKKKIAIVNIESLWLRSHSSKVGNVFNNALAKHLLNYDEVHLVAHSGWKAVLSVDIFQHLQSLPHKGRNIFIKNDGFEFPTNYEVKKIDPETNEERIDWREMPVVKRYRNLVHDIKNFEANKEQELSFFFIEPKKTADDIGEDLANIFADEKLSKDKPCLIPVERLFVDDKYDDRDELTQPEAFIEEQTDKLTKRYNAKYFDRFIALKQRYEEAIKYRNQIVAAYEEAENLANFWDSKHDPKYKINDLATRLKNRDPYKSCFNPDKLKNKTDLIQAEIEVAQLIIDCERLEKKTKKLMLGQASAILEKLDQLHLKIESKRLHHLKKREQFLSKYGFIKKVEKDGLARNFEQACKDYDHYTSRISEDIHDDAESNVALQTNIRQFKQLKTLDTEQITTLADNVLAAQRSAKALSLAYDNADRLLNEVNKEADRYIENIILRIHNQIEELSNHPIKWLFMSSGDDKQEALKALATNITTQYNGEVTKNAGIPLNDTATKQLVCSVIEEWYGCYRSTVNETRAHINWFTKQSKTSKFIGSLYDEAGGNELPNQIDDKQANNQGNSITLVSRHIVTFVRS